MADRAKRSSITVASSFESASGWALLVLALCIVVFTDMSGIGSLSSAARGLIDHVRMRIEPPFAVCTVKVPEQPRTENSDEDRSLTLSDQSVNEKEIVFPVPAPEAVHVRTDMDEPGAFGRLVRKAR
ncbi:MAG: hypothetical protein AAB036_07270 [Elusimicrobiota bacterium]